MMKIKNYLMDQEIISNEEYRKQIKELMAEAENKGDD